jgi:kynurenine formamidase
MALRRPWSTTVERPQLRLEQLTNLSALPPSGFEVMVLPLKIVGASAAPARVVAVIR